LTNATVVQGTEDGIEVVDLYRQGMNAKEVAAFREEVLKRPSLVNQVVGEAGRHAVLILRPQHMSEPDMGRVVDAIESVLEAHSGEGFQGVASGLAVMGHHVNEAMLSDMRVLMSAALLIMAFFLILLFRNFPSVVGPGVVVVLAAIWTFGLMATVGMPVTMISNILPAFLVTVGVGDSVHLLSIYRDRRCRVGSNHEAIVFAIASTGRPVLFTSLTTMVGLLSFRFSSLDAIQDMGTAGGFGVMLAFLFSVVLLPIGLSFRGDVEPDPTGDLAIAPEADGGLLNRALDACSWLSKPGPASHPKRRRRLALFALVVLIGVSVYGMSKLTVYHNPLAWIPQDTAMVKSFDTIDNEVGGTTNVQLLVDGSPEHGVKDKALLEAIERLERELRRYEDVHSGQPVFGASFSLLDVLKETNQALHGGDPAYYRIPETQRGISDALFMFENADRETMGKLTTTDMSRMQVTLRSRWLDATSYLPLTHQIEAGIEEIVGDTGRVQATGAVYTLVNVISNMIFDLMKSFGAAFVFITFMMIFMLRGLKIGLIAMVPNLVPILIIMAFMGFTGLPIDFNSLLIASVAIGLAVDDTIHFLHHFKVAYEASGDVEWSIHHAIRRAGRAIVSTSLILAMGFMAYLVSDMINIQRFGLLTGLTVLAAVSVDLIFAPALIRTFYTDRPVG
jgi:predicted RND superfamily exporter protein